MRRIGPLVIAVLFVPAAAYATGHNADVSAGLSGAFGSAFWGAHGTFAVTVPKPSNPKDFSLVLADLGIYTGSDEGNDETRFSYMGGARWTFATKDYADPQRKFLASAHGLIGVVHTNNGGGNELAFATGVAVERLLADSASSEAGWGIRGQADWVVQKGEADNFFRLSVEVVHRFKKEHK